MRTFAYVVEETGERVAAEANSSFEARLTIAAQRPEIGVLLASYAKGDAMRDTIASVDERLNRPGLGYGECGDCGRTFDLLDEVEAAEFAYGHDCDGSVL